MGQSKQKNKSTALLFIEYVKIRAHSKREQGKLSTAELYEVAGRHFERFLGKSERGQQYQRICNSGIR